MSKSEDYLDQLLKGVSPEDIEHVEEKEDALEENLFSDILEEFADNNTAERFEHELVEEVQQEDEFVAEDEEDDFLEGDFDDEDIFGEDFFDDEILDDDFLEEFEMELANLENETEEREETVETGGEEEDVLSLFGDLDSILSGAKEQMESVSAPEVEVEPELSNMPEFEPELEPALESEFVMEPEPQAEIETVEKAPEEPAFAVEEGFSFADLFAEDGESSSEPAPQEDADVLKILEGLEGIDLELEDDNVNPPSDEGQDFGALEGFLAASAASADSEGPDFGVDDVDIVEESGEEAEESKQKKGKKAPKAKKEGEKTGFLSKLSLLLFGEDEDEEEEAASKGKNTESVSDDISIGVASDDDLALFGEYSGGTSSVPAEEQKVDKKAEQKALKEKKKQEKKEKQEQAKKAKLEKKAKAKKEKKPKPPKEPDNTPPLPKKPVLLIFVMVASLVALILLGADLLGYSNHITNAKNQYAKKNYSEAFAEISGMEMKGEEDLLLYEKYHVMAMVSAELEAYESLASQGFYDMALDCLVRTIGRTEKYSEDAKSYGCLQEMEALALEAEERLSEHFGVSREEALEFYSYRDKKDYSRAINAIIKELGLER